MNKGSLFYLKISITEFLTQSNSQLVKFKLFNEEIVSSIKTGCFRYSIPLSQITHSELLFYIYQNHLSQSSILSNHVIDIYPIYLSISKAQKYMICWNNTNSKDLNYIKLTLSISDNSLTEDSFNNLQSALLMSPSVITNHTLISFYLFKFEEDDHLFSDPQIENHSYYFMIKFIDYHIKTKRVYNNELRSLIHCCVPIINDKDQFFQLELFKNNQLLSSYKVCVDHIIKGNYNTIQYISMISSDYAWKNNLLLKIIHDLSINYDCMRRGNEVVLFQEKDIPLQSIQEAKNKGRTHIWNITLSINQISCQELKKSQLLIFIGNQKKELTIKKILPINISFQYQTISNNQKEISDIILHLTYKSCLYIGIITPHQNKSIIILKPINLIKGIQQEIPFITLKYALNYDFTSIVIPVMKNIKNNSINHKELPDEEKDDEIDSSLSSVKKSYLIIVNIFLFKESRLNSKRRLEKRGNISVNIKNQKQSIDYISNNIHQRLFFKNNKIDRSDKTTWPIIEFDYYQHESSQLALCSHDLFDLSYSLNQSDINTNKQWIELMDYNSHFITHQIQCSIDLIEETNYSFISLIQSQSIVPMSVQYTFDFTSLGFRNEYHFENDIYKSFSIDLLSSSIRTVFEDEPQLAITKDLFFHSNKTKGSNSNNLFEIKEEINLPYDTTQALSIIGNVFNHYSCGKDENIAQIDIPTKTIIYQSHTIIDKIISSINLKCFGGSNKDNIFDSEIIAIPNADPRKSKEIILEISDNKSLLKNNEEKPLILTSEKNEEKIEYEPLGFSKSSDSIKDKLKEEKNINVNSIVILPIITQYKVPGFNNKKHDVRTYECEDISQLPNMLYFKSIGDKKEKHYRRFFNNPLENEEALRLHSPFYKIPINTLDNGFIKAIVRIIENDRMAQYNSVKTAIETKMGDLSKEFPLLYQHTNLINSIKSPVKVILRLYITDILCNSLDNKEIRIFLNNNLIETNNDKICSRYDIVTILPGNAFLKIELWEKSDLLEDSYIGMTIIDIEDRFYDEKWKEMKDKPIETRPLFKINNDTNYNNPNDKLCLWLDIHSKDNINNQKVWDISKSPKDNKFEIRAVVYETEFNDGITSVNKETNDLYVSLSTNQGSERQYTDIHYNCDGYGHFNWRLKSTVDYIRNSTENDYIITLKLCDYNSSNEELCYGTFNAKPLLEIIYNSNSPIAYTKQLHEGLEDSQRLKELNFNQDSHNQFWLNLFGGNVIKGRILLSIEILPYQLANEWNVGKGRDNPNINPHLTYPLERINITTNPFHCIRNHINQRTRKKLCKLLFCTCIIFYFIFLIPYVIYHMSGEAVNPWNYVYLNYIRKNDNRSN